jgi:hypothetical protein
MTAPDHPAIKLLEDELFNFDGVAEILMTLTRSDEIEDHRLYYLAGQLKAHYRAARDAWEDVERELERRAAT